MPIRRRGAGRRGWARAALAVAGTALLLVIATPGTGEATVGISRAELQGSRLRIEGTAAANRPITVDGVTMGSSNGSGRFRIERSGFTAPADCTVDVNDGSAAATVARLSGCTVGQPPPASSLSALTLSAATVPVTTNPVTNAQSSIIIGTAGGITRHFVLTVMDPFHGQNGSISLARAGGGEGRVTSQPAGIDCTFTPTGTIGACNNAFFPAGTRVRLEARPLNGSSFLGWDFETTCRDAPDVTIAAGVAHICRPGFAS